MAPPPGLRAGGSAPRPREGLFSYAVPGSRPPARPFWFPAVFPPAGDRAPWGTGSHTCQPRTNKYFGGWGAAHELSALLGTGTNRACTTACSPLPVRRRCRRRSSLKPISCRCRLWGSKDLSPGFGEGCGKRKASLAGNVQRWPQGGASGPRRDALGAQRLGAVPQLRLGLSIQEPVLAIN